MEIQEYEVRFLINRPKRPPEIVDTYICLSHLHFDNSPNLTKEEVIVRESLFIMSDRLPLQIGITIKLLKYEPVKKGMLLGFRSRSKEAGN